MFTCLIFPSSAMNSNSHPLYSHSPSCSSSTPDSALSKQKLPPREIRGSEMLKQELDHFRAKCKRARLCDSCNSVRCTVYCRVDSAYLCIACDTQIHQVPSSQDHERVWVCEACEQHLTVFLCEADSASLCASCDADIHSGDPLANRHHHVPILPIGTRHLYATHDREADDQAIITNKGDEDDAASWLLLNTTACNYNETNLGKVPSNGFGLDGEVDQFMGLFEFHSGVENHICNQLNQQHNNEFCVPEKNCGGDSVVPVQFGESKENHYQSFLFGMEFETKSEYSYNPSITHSCYQVSVSSMDVGVVPESTVIHPRPRKGTNDLFSGPTMQMTTQVFHMDREARVMRYREKKKTRRFEKTIRYASRKAYAETRPRIKGRFVKRRDAQVEMDETLLPTSLVADSGYGIVPSL